MEYANGEREYYDLDSDPYELTNTYAKLSPDEVDALHSQLYGLENCHSSATCKPVAGPGGRHRADPSARWQAAKMAEPGA